MTLIRREFYALILLGIILPCLCFAGIAIAVFTHDFSLIWDIDILKEIHTQASPELDAITIALTQLGRGKTIAAITVLHH